MNSKYFITVAATALLCATRSLPAFSQGASELTGTFHGNAHATSGTVQVLPSQNGSKVLRLTNFKTSNGPDVHVILITADDAVESQRFLPSGVQRIELGLLKGNEGNQNYVIPAGTDLAKFKTVVIYCQRFNATFGAAPLHN